MRPPDEATIAIGSRSLLTQILDSFSSEPHEADMDIMDKDAKTLISEYKAKKDYKVVLATLNINSIKN